MAQTLQTLRGYLNAELGVTADAETTPMGLILRNRAISQGYAALWRKGCWKPTQQSLAAVSDQTVYTTTIRRLRVIDVLDSTGNVIDHAPGRIEETTSSSFQLILKGGIVAGYTLRVNGWNAYKSTFSGDSDPDDLDDEWNRIPLLKAKEIVYRKVTADFARYGSRQTVKAQMNVSVTELIGLISAAKREFDDETHEWAKLRDRVMQPSRTRQFIT